MYQLFDGQQPRTVRPTPSTAQAARRALAICQTADALAHEAEYIMDSNEDRLMALLEARDEMLADLAEELAALRHEHRTADSPLYATTERAVDDADAVLDQVTEALHRAKRVTVELTAKVAARVEELRAELAAVQRAGNAGMVYGRDHGGASLVDLRR
jgi:hypothetical protein